MAFRFAVLTVISDGITARYGTPFTPLNHFSPWNVDDDGAPRRERQTGRRRRSRDRAGVPDRRCVQPGTVPAAAAQLHRLRRRRGRLRQADRQAAPVLRGHQGGRLDGRGGREQRQGRRRLAHPGLGQVDGDGALRPPREHPARSCKNPTIVVVTDRNELDGQLFETLQPVSRLLAGEPGQGDQARASCATNSPTAPPAASTSPRCRSSACTERGTEAGARPPAAVRPAQHHRHRRRGPPQPLRRPRRLRPPHARRAAQRRVHRVHRHPDLLRRPQHRGGVRRRTSTSTTSPARSRTAPPCRCTSSRG